jgi:hypothetical protein
MGTERKQLDGCIGGLLVAVADADADGLVASVQLEAEWKTIPVV